MIITIDGPVASGKSTVARELAQKIGVYYLGTGMMFRGAAYLLFERASYDQQGLINPDKKDLDIYLDPKRFMYDCDNSYVGRIFFDGEDLTSFLKDSRMDVAASILSMNKDVRQALLLVQRECGKKYDLVAEGRDVGSVVFPGADFKFFLTASVPVRAKRWKADQKKKGNMFSLGEAVKKINARDARDSTRNIAPLVKPAGAIVIDSSELNLKETLEKIENYIQKK